MRMLGYGRPDGRIGTRNHVAIIFCVACSEVVARRIAALFPRGTVVLGIPQGCHFKEPPFRKVVALGRHPNVAAALVVGLGCEGTEASWVAQEIAKAGKPVEAITIQAVGGDIRTIEVGSRMVAQMLQHASLAPQVELTPKDLVVCGKCGGSDATSGLAANPAVGMAGDLVIEAGGTFMISETVELIGCGEVLAQRAVNPEVAQDIREAIADAERRSLEAGYYSIGLGNIQGGLTTIEEKSAGALSKAGTQPLQGVIRQFESELRPGFYIEAVPPGAGTFSGDPESINIMTACGANVALFTTGCGSTTGGAIVPVIKICGNPVSCQRIQDNLDIDASPIMKGEKTIAQVGEEIYREILAAAGGKLTKSEIMGHFEA